MKPDLTYRPQGLFTAFFPETKAGEDAWRELHEQTGGNGKIFNHHLPQTLAALRRAGYTVAKAKSVRASDADLLAELGRGAA